jgi:hypothetical protein
MPFSRSTPNDPEILSAPDEDPGITDRDLRDVVTRFRTLSAERKRAVLPRLDRPQEPCPILRYRSVSTQSFVEAKIQTRDESTPGVCRFDDEEVQSAEIRLSACLPYPARYTANLLPTEATVSGRPQRHGRPQPLRGG